MVTPLAVEVPLIIAAVDVVDPLAAVTPLVVAAVDVVDPLAAVVDVVDPLVEAVLAAARDRSEVAMARTWDSYET